MAESSHVTNLHKFGQNDKLCILIFLLKFDFVSVNASEDRLLPYFLCEGT